MTPDVSKKRWNVDWNINSAGFRDYVHELETTRFRIVALGDSYLVGNEVAFEDTFLRRLELELDVEVVKLAVEGYGTIQERIVWEEEGRKYHPNLVLLGVYLGNDLHDNARWPRHYCVRGGRLTSCRYDYSTRTARIAHWLATNSMLTRRLLIMFPDIVPVRAKTPRKKDGRNEETTVVIRWGAEVEELYRKDWPASMKQGYHRMVDNIRLLHESVVAAGATLVVLIIPHESQIYEWQWLDYMDTNELDPTDYDPEKSVRLLVEWLSSKGILFINLLPHLREAGKTDPNLHPDHWHWSVKANQLVADLVASYLKENQLLQPK